MVAANEISWGSYRDFEGPFYRGKHGYTLPGSPTEEDKILAVITATEGGHFDAWNGYDVCGWTSGLIQWCERNQYSVSDMLGAVAERDIGLLHGFLQHASTSGLTFKRNAKGRWRLSFLDHRGEVDSQLEQDQLFYIDGNGKKGSWGSESRLWGKGWAAAISTVWENSVAQWVQTNFTVARLGGFMTGYAKSVFGSRPNTPVARAAYAAYLSFAANNPARAGVALQTALNQNAHLAAWSQDWFNAVLRELTFGPRIAIYPHRYDAIRPVLEKLYGLNLPDFSADLASWSKATGIAPGVSLKRIQEALIALGYDLGPKGADGVDGPKTRAAVLTFEQLSGMVPPEHQNGVVDDYTWPALQTAISGPP